MAVQRRQARAAEYRRLATAAHALAETSLLAHVREKHQQAAAQWTALAVFDERPAEAPSSRAAERAGAVSVGIDA